MTSPSLFFLNNVSETWHSFFFVPEKYFAAQSLDNQVLVYSTDNFRQARNKRFAGHSIAGYACQVGFSPDGKWISSGDGEGNMIFWEWKTGRIKSRLKTHSKVVITHEWLPHETVRCFHPSINGVNLNCAIVSLMSVVLSCIVKGHYCFLGRPHKTLGAYWTVSLRPKCQLKHPLTPVCACRIDLACIQLLDALTVVHLYASLVCFTQFRQVDPCHLYESVGDAG